MAQAPATDRLGETRLLNRELSALEFYGRVLELASDDGVPLLERVRFCAIFSSHLDEFFMVRVAGLRGQAESSSGVRSADGRTPEQALVEIRERALELTTRQGKLWKRELRPELATEGIVVAHVRDREPDVREVVCAFDTLMADNNQAWDLAGDGHWRRARPDQGEQLRPAQDVLMRGALARARQRLGSGPG